MHEANVNAIIRGMTGKDRFLALLMLNLVYYRVYWRPLAWSLFYLMSDDGAKGLKAIFLGKISENERRLKESQGHDYH
jgi:hypothetical protein